MTTSRTYIVAGCRPWNRPIFERMPKPEGTLWHFIESKEELSPEYLSTVAPRYIFFWHWSWIVPRAIVEQYECVCFHMTDLPFGRGGSPLQNLISKGHSDTRLTALRMTNELDAGDIYMKKRLSLSGAAQSIYERATSLCAEMTLEIARNSPATKPQQGEPVFFKRRTPEQSELPPTLDLTELYNHIRMLDAEGYPHAFCTFGNYHISFSDAAIKKDTITATVQIRLKN